MLKCCECGKVFEDGEVARWREDRGEFWGFKSYETMTGCPSCRGEYEEAEMCENCGEYFFEDELDENHLCEDCREDTGEEE